VNGLDLIAALGRAEHPDHDPEILLALIVGGHPEPLFDRQVVRFKILKHGAFRPFGASLP